MTDKEANPEEKVLITLEIKRSQLAYFDAWCDKTGMTRSSALRYAIYLLTHGDLKGEEGEKT